MAPEDKKHCPTGAGYVFIVNLSTYSGKKQRDCHNIGDTIGVGNNCWPSQCIPLNAIAVHTFWVRWLSG